MWQPSCASLAVCGDYVTRAEQPSLPRCGGSHRRLRQLHVDVREELLRHLASSIDGLDHQPHAVRVVRPAPVPHVLHAAPSSCCDLVLRLRLGLAHGAEEQGVPGVGEDRARGVATLPAALVGPRRPHRAVAAPAPTAHSPLRPSQRQRLAAAGVARTRQRSWDRALRPRRRGTSAR